MNAAAPAPRRLGLIALVAVVVLVLDQLTKWWAVNTLADRSIAVVWTLQLQLARNTGAAFSMGRGNDWIRFVPLLVLGFVAYVIFQGRSSTSRLGAVALGMIVGGAIGNLVDRAFRSGGGAFFSGGVIDFIDFQWWPVFNVADMGVVIGGVLLVAVTVLSPGDEPVREPATGPASEPADGSRGEPRGEPLDPTAASTPATTDGGARFDGGGRVDGTTSAGGGDDAVGTA